jgi:hypothetical protein
LPSQAYEGQKAYPEQVALTVCRFAAVSSLCYNFLGIGRHGIEPQCKTRDHVQP